MSWKNIQITFTPKPGGSRAQTSDIINTDGAPLKMMCDGQHATSCQVEVQRPSEGLKVLFIYTLTVQKQPGLECRPSCRR